MRPLARRSSPLLCAAALALLLAGPLSAQQQQEPPTRDRDTVRREAALDRLRGLGAAGAPDTIAADTAASAEAAEGREPGDSPRGTAGADAETAETRPPLAQWTGDAEADSIFAALRRLEGYSPMEYRGTGARFDALTGRLELDGEATVEREGQTMTADSVLVYEQQRSVICGYGKPVLSGEGSPVESDQVCYDTGRQVGSALGARTTFTETAEWFIHGREVRTVGAQHLYGHSADFTACDLEVPHYHFGAGEIKVVKDDILVARSVTMNFQDVPVFWLPFMVQSLKQGRRSGLLTPTIGINDVARTRTSYERNIDNLGFYWAMNDHMDAQVALNWYSNNYTGLRGGLQFRWAEQFLNGNFNFTRFWSESGTNFTLMGGGSWQPAERTSVNVSANWASSSRFVRDNSFDPHELSRSINSTMGLNHRFRSGASLNISGNRTQYLANDQVEMSLPNLTLSLPTVTLLSAPPDQASWYNNMTWQGNGGFNMQTTTFGDASAGRRDRGTLTANARSSFSLGNLSWSQSANLREQSLHAREQTPELPGVDREVAQDLNWSSSLSYRIPLFGTTAITPNIAASGQLRKSPETFGAALMSPTTMSTGASLNMDIYGFWPGIGPFERFRHKVSPTFSYSYAPRVSVTDEQYRVFGSEIRERNVITLNLTQTFEARYRTDESQQEQAGPADDDGADLDPDAPASGEPRRLPRAPTATVLSLSTSVMTYDFVRAREENLGFTTTRLTNQVRSDLAKGLQLTVEHDLFKTDSQPCVALPGMPCLRPDPPPPVERTFAPHLSRVQASFDIDGTHWLVRMFGLGRSSEAPEEDPADDDWGEDRDEDPLRDLQQPPRAGSLMGRRDDDFGRRGGPWTASISYRLDRPRSIGTASAGGDQTVISQLRFQPTQHWSLNWSTDYSFTRREFGYHMLTLTRDLHDWDASFNFARAQNGNFSFHFNVSLRANRDIKFDYDQRDRTSF